MIALGNKDQYGAIHMWGGIQGAYDAGAGRSATGSSTRTARRSTPPGNLKSLKKLKEWADKGYLGKGDSFNARSDADAAAAFGKGEGAFVLGGNWNAAIAATGSASDAAFFDMPPGDSGKAVAIGSASIPMHISAKTKNPDLAAAYLDFITGPTAGQALVDTQQVPAATDGTAEPGDPLGQDVKDGLGQARQGRRPDAVPGLVVADDARRRWARRSRRCWPGRISPEDVVKRTQADWDELPLGARRGLAVAASSRAGVAGAPRARRRTAAELPRCACARRASPGASPTCTWRRRWSSTCCSRSGRWSTRRGCRSSTGTG